jgi:hypothetical protein
MKMKKIIFGLFAAAGLLTACDPSVDSISAPASSLTSQVVDSEFSFKQCAQNEDGTYVDAADGNFFFFNVSAPYKSVVVYNYDADGNENILASGFSGNFKIQPKRGGDPNQSFYVRAVDKDGTVVEIKKDVVVFVPTELSSDMKFLCSASGTKVWTWDTGFRSDGAVWGNLGYAPGDGNSFVNDGNGIWWGCPPADLTGQLGHSDTGVATGEEDPNAYMVLDEDGNVKCFASDGVQIRSGKFRVTAWDEGNRSFASADGSQPAWSLGTLHTDAGSILFPFQINSHNDDHDKTTCPTDFEIMQLDGSHLKLIYPQAGTGGWTEATWWAFKSNSDAEGSLTNYGEKSWTWDTEFRGDGGAWGNLGYAPGDGNSFVNDGNGIWWGCPPADLTGQLNHSDTGAATGEEDAGAYMTFNYQKGTISSFAANGSQIRSGKFEISAWDQGKRSYASVDGSQAAWSLGTLHTDAGSILFPFQINSHNDDHDKTTCPTDFEIMQLDGSHLKLIYPQSGTGGWTEATWWAFKKK